jgi:alpha-glucosidase
MELNDLKWWQKAVFYQIYPRSFADGNGDGIGDLTGMIEKLDYLQELGVDALWLSPHYPSPLYDCGYDIADYTGVASEYGTLDDFQRFLDGAQQRGMRVILDLVLNHTSDEHAWFKESRSSRDNPKRDWYIWRDGKDGGPPNNWYSTFGGSAWEYDPDTEQYYYHFFFKEQPDLNWRNPEVKQATWDAVRFWLDRGVDGFRLDAIGTVFEDVALPDHTCTVTLLELQRALHETAVGARDEAERQRRSQEWLALFKEMFQYQHDLPEIHELMQEMRSLVDVYEDRVLVGETDDILFYGDGSNELHLAFNFPLMRTERLTPAWVRANQQLRLSTLPPGAWACNTLGNHDSPRVYSRYGDGENDAAIARISLALMLTLRGTPFLYNGEEIGMTDLLLSDVAQFRDNLGVCTYYTLVDDLGLPPAEAVKLAALRGRDKCRTPMQWANAPNGGFSPTGVETWLPVNGNYAEGVNVAEQADDPDSLLSFYRRMLAVRKQTPALIAGDYVPLHADAADYVAFLRTDATGEQRCLVVLNMSAQPQRIGFQDAELGGAVAQRQRPAEARSCSARLVFSSHSRTRTEENPSNLALAPFEVYIAHLV